ncbi:MAG: DnaJ family domain-containing protein [Chloroflexota bacterium]
MKFVEDLIRRAQQGGDFKDLTNKGKRIKLDENPYTSETRIPHGIMKQAGYRPQFIDQSKYLKSEVKEARAILQKASENWTGTKWSKIRWNQAETEFREKVAKLNKQIRDYNLKAPNEQFFIIPVDPERELKIYSPENSGGS